MTGHAAWQVMGCYVSDRWTQPGDGLWGLDLLPLFLVTLLGFLGVATLSRTWSSRSIGPRNRDIPAAE